MYLDFWCPECDIKRREEERIRAEADKRQEAEARWIEFCPRLFHATDPSKLPNQMSYAKAMRWEFSPRGLLLHGPTGSGKSRTAWLLLKREFFRRKVGLINSSSALYYAGLFSSSSESACQWADKLCACDLLLLDDVFKVKLTESFEAALFAIVDRMSERMQPLIVTTNDTGQSLKERLSPDRSDPLLRRLREGSDSIAFL